MPVWERYSQTATLTTIGSHQNTEVFHNEVDAHTFQSRDIVIVDGIVYVHNDGAEMWGVRLIVAPEVMASGDITENYPPPHDNMVYYSWFVGGNSPLIFRLRSKKTIPSEHKLWINVWKEQGGSQETLRTGQHLLFVQKR